MRILRPVIALVFAAVLVVVGKQAVTHDISPHTGGSASVVEAGDTGWGGHHH
ncbi:hypothetical protein [Streptomyces cellostaticus]|uniref:hypothetical protein n=1 Tax=Streptomyces cellostaticus TaxID=67285 RepID=UPI000A48CFB4|nr:hypothetical protein [Streptomyces cellostaticus]GHI09717.1 hypothetical protein Scel_80380 [Streptomyces cellostaticus]